ncbi:MAG: aldehyde ferredoxin oxidoreductase family protein [Dehalococcoidales bacterium]
MSGGYMGKLLWVDLSTGTIKEEALEERLCRDFIGGNGIGARILYSRQKSGIDPLGPENTLGLITGPLTGVPIPAATRYIVVAKSPLTGGWGESNSGGDFGPYLKFAGFDGVFFTGISPKPVYLLIDEGKAQLKDAGHLWGKDTYETEDVLMAEYGKQSRVACIGPVGEKLSLISCIITDHGSAAGRSGLGAVMGSKKLKAVVARGTLDVPISNRTNVDAIKKVQINSYKIPGPNGMSVMDIKHRYGTSIATYGSAHSGDSPVKNWGGIGVIDLPDRQGLHENVFAARVEKGHTCWRCPLACKATLKAGEAEYKYAAGCRRPEYETASAFGSNCANSHTESIIMCNDICNRAGIDTISGGSVIAFAMELYENGIITKNDTDGIDLKWGNHQAMVAMTKKLVKREGLGDILADGVKIAAEKIGKGSEKFAVHIGGQEPGMHDPKLPMHFPSTEAARYQMDATPGRHHSFFGPSSFVHMHFQNAAGLCFPGRWDQNHEQLVGIFNAVTGWNYSWSDMLKAGERIANIRHAFNLREGITELKWPVHPRIVGKPPQTAGPLAGVTANIEAQVYWCLGALDWDIVTTKPSKTKLLSLGGLDDVANDLWP